MSLSFFLLVLSTCACVEYYGRALETLIKKVSVHCIHGKMKNKRNKIFADFRALKRSDFIKLCMCCCWLFLSLLSLHVIHDINLCVFLQRDLGVHRRYGQRNRYPRCELGAAVRSSQQCQVRKQTSVCKIRATVKHPADNTPVQVQYLWTTHHLKEHRKAGLFNIQF